MVDILLYVAKVSLFCKKTKLFEEFMRFCFAVFVFYPIFA